ncbi:hypothetical protein HMPREF9347_02706 [Escherichia coli MS 124-1]|nr:hypothetical protein MJ49_08535 [Escherichia coli]EFJ85465.1 hypothetical protein HMPREF9536_04243 [Escherichia coli MS 84-1]EFK68280.1 hypothetical protein HMPREF9347_02706 [Escherichia coli MS 124-1]
MSDFQSRLLLWTKNRILNLYGPWQVASLSLDENAGSVAVTVGIAEITLLSWPVHDHRHRK